MQQHCTFGALSTPSPFGSMGLGRTSLNGKHEGKNEGSKK
jgi:hypothetical protein